MPVQECEQRGRRRCEDEATGLACGAHQLQLGDVLKDKVACAVAAGRRPQRVHRGCVLLQDVELLQRPQLVFDRDGSTPLLIFQGGSFTEYLLPLPANTPCTLNPKTLKPS